MFSIVTNRVSRGKKSFAPGRSSPHTPGKMGHAVPTSIHSRRRFSPVPSTPSSLCYAVFLIFYFALRIEKLFSTYEMNFSKDERKMRDLKRVAEEGGGRRGERVGGKNGNLCR